MGSKSPRMARADPREARPSQITDDEPTFDPRADGFFDDPFPQYGRLRARNPIHVDERGVAFCFAYDDVRQVLIDSTSTSMDRELRDGEVVLAPGTMAFVCCGSANRDPDHFGPTASELDITRADAKDGLSFGAGIHYCIGAHFARREAALVINRLLGRFPDVALAREPVWGRRMTFRSLEELRVTLH